MFTPLEFQGSFLVTGWIQDTDLNNGGFFFVIYFVVGDNMFQMFEKTVFLWVISYGISHATWLWIDYLSTWKKWQIIHNERIADYDAI